MDSSLDFSSAEAQSWMLNICNELHTKAIPIDGDADTRTGTYDASESRLVRNMLGSDEVNCFMKGFHEYVTFTAIQPSTQNVNQNGVSYQKTYPLASDVAAKAAGGDAQCQVANTVGNSACPALFPVPQGKFDTVFGEWLTYRELQKSNGMKWDPPNNYENQLWIDPSGKIKMAKIFANSTMPRWYQSNKMLTQERKRWEKWKEEKDATAPAGLKKFFTKGKEDSQNSAWIFLKTQNKLVSGALYGIFMSMLFAFIILTLSNGNPIISGFAILNLSGIICCILGLIAGMGWELGMIESISLTILVGLSVDYVVHLANAYIESGIHFDTRQERVREGVTEMGVTVLGGAITSIGASLQLFFCYFIFFFKFGVFFNVTILFSFTWAFLFFLPLLALVGPEGDFGDVRQMYLAKLGAKASAKVAVVPDNVVSENPQDV
jgi:hypothetical protein